MKKKAGHLFLFAKRRQRNKSSKKKKIIFKPKPSKYLVITFKSLAFVIVFVSLLAGLIYFFLSDIFKISKIECQVNGQACQDEEQVLILDFYGENIFLFNEKKNKKIIEASKVEIKRTIFKKRLPNKLLIKFEKRQGIALVSKDKQNWFLIDKDGYVFQKFLENPNDYPLIHWPDENIYLHFGLKLDKDELLAALEFLSLIKDSFLKVELIELRNSSITIFLNDNLIASLSASKKIVNQVDSLQFILRQSKIEGEPPRWIDIRFDKPVVKY
ncbi:hypothetical protein COT75_02655 [Candidatus Beckwithbacteria bacterium CG10_big_fil_rev_8_21_14_0_10_34_10]|uniref:POTRA domain-containing protein n=1 Tax=Candidatus Beckwithbacteria bacterium CG10_big_fil_rev_8_21_14_0_10_34_10 TaxID=1974495 RepID=A0A2H0W945_9BACT|nr:MAG: hypothetical protein COT75_02655 [Candidatus Beckwithbacteria bacterium CG10_big_fil_rev_8_21_14_0_10_34_10]